MSESSAVVELEAARVAYWGTDCSSQRPKWTAQPSNKSPLLLKLILSDSLELFYLALVPK